jgi:hypothetical protein
MLESRPMNPKSQFATRPAAPTRDRRAELLAKLEAMLRADGGLALADDEGGLDPYNTTNGRVKRDVWGSRPR